MTIGSPATFKSALQRSNSTTYLDDTHFVVIYQDYYNSQKGTAVVGTVSNDDEISYGSAYVFSTGECAYTSVDRLDDTHFVVVWVDTDHSDKGTSIIGTVSNDDEISFGDEILFYDGAVRVSSLDSTGVDVCSFSSSSFVVSFTKSTNIDGSAVIGIVSNIDEINYGSVYSYNASSMFWDTCNSLTVLDSSRFVICYRHSYYSSNPVAAVVGTVSNDNEISYGSSYSFTYNDVSYMSVTSLDANKFVVSFFDQKNKVSNVVVGIISNDDEIAYGSFYEYESFYALYNNIKKIDSDRFLLSYQDYNDSKQGKTLIGTVSNDDEVSFGTAVIFESGETAEIHSSFLDSSSFVISYSDVSESNYGKAIIGILSATTPDIRINIGDTWKTVESMKINIGDTWKDVDLSSSQLNIGDTWKDLST